MPNQDNILLQTKLHRPPITRDLVDRPRLFEQLNNGIDRPLTLIAASAGFGKTTLVSAWLEGMAAGQFASGSSFPAAWLSLDENDSDPNVFIRYFIAALRTIFADACEQTLILLQARQELPLSTLYATLSNEIEQLSESFILVLDDYHTIGDVKVHDLLAEWARHWPKPLHLVLISRINPSMPLASLRAKGQISEIRTLDLRFTPEEAADYLSQSQFTLRGQNTLHLLEERFEGWPAGLHLAALSLRSAGSQESVLSALSSENPDITAYLLDEVLNHQVPEVRSFLLKTSILDRYCASLCQAIMGMNVPAWSVRAYLDWIERSELFVVPLDTHREWYRYHHLFQELLQQKLSAEMAPEQLNDLHRLASAWFEEHGSLNEALHHALAAGDFDLAARQMYTGLCEVLNRQDRLTLDRWQRLIPEEMFQQQPQLMMIRIWSLEFQWKLDLQFELIQQLEVMLNSDAGIRLPANDLMLIQGQLLGLKAQWAYFTNQPAQAIEICRQVLALLPPTWKYLRGGVMIYLGLSMQSIGQALTAEQLLLSEYEACNEKTEAYALQIIESLGFNYINSGQLEDAIRIGLLLAQGGASGGLSLLKNWGDYYLGVAYFEQYELEIAEQYFSKVVENRFTAQLACYHDSAAGLAVVRQLMGKNAEAWQMMESLSQFDMEQSGREDDRTRSLRARLMLLRGNLEGASHWADTFTDLLPDVPIIWLEEPHITRARILADRGTEADLHLALQILNTLDEIANRTHNTRRKIEILTLRAYALDALGQNEAADTDLGQALALSSLGGFTRVYVELGRPMQKMLQRVAKQNHSMEIIQHILAAFPDDGQNPTVSGRAEATALDPMPLIVPLTSRELEVLNLLRGPLSVKEIALKLGISYATTKRHTINIYGKLGVNQRWNAIARAEELHILSPR